MPGSKGLNPHELAHRWGKDLGTRPDMSFKSNARETWHAILVSFANIYPTESLCNKSGA